MSKKIISISIAAAVVIIGGTIILIWKLSGDSNGSSKSVCRPSKMVDLNYLLSMEQVPCEKDEFKAVLSVLLPEIDQTNAPKYISNHQETLKDSTQARNYFKTLMDGKKLKRGYEVVEVQDDTDWNGLRIAFEECAQISNDDSISKDKLRYLLEDTCPVTYLSKEFPSTINKKSINDIAFALEASTELRQYFEEKIKNYNQDNEKKLTLFENLKNVTVAQVTDWKNVDVLFLESNCLNIFNDANSPEFLKSLVLNFFKCEGQQKQILDLAFPAITSEKVKDYLKNVGSISDNEMVITHIKAKIKAFETQSQGKVVVSDGDIVDLETVTDFKGKTLHYQSPQCLAALKDINSEKILTQEFDETICSDLKPAISARMDEYIPVIPKNFEDYLNQIKEHLGKSHAVAKFKERLIEFNQNQTEEMFLVLFDGQRHVSNPTDWSNIEIKDFSTHFKQEQEPLFNFLNKKTNKVEFEMTQNQMNNENCAYIKRQLERNRRVLYTGFQFTQECVVNLDTHLMFRYDLNELDKLNEILNVAPKLLSTTEKKQQLKNDFVEIKAKNPDTFYWVDGSENNLANSIDLYTQGQRFREIKLTYWFSYPFTFSNNVVEEFMLQFGGKEGENTLAYVLNSYWFWRPYRLSFVVKALVESSSRPRADYNLLRGLPVKFNVFETSYECLGPLESIKCLGHKGVIRV